MTGRSRSLVFSFLAVLSWGCENPIAYWGSGAEGNAGRAGEDGAGGRRPDDTGIGFGGNENTAGTTGAVECGNGDLEPGELCDDGGTQDDDGCSADCLEQDPDYACLTPGEACEKVVNCGNGVLEGDEICDDENTESDDGCSEDCSAVEDGWVCPRPGRPCVELPNCGNGVYERGEACDDGNAESGDGCSGTEDPLLVGCQLEEGYWCPNPGDDCIALECGDGNRTPEEECDDGDNSSGDGCSAACAVEDGWQCSTSDCNPICGDGIIVGTEACDDANRASGDGCSAACAEEPYHDCTGEPSECVSTIECDNGTVEPGEICDPPGEDGCSADCLHFAPNTSTAPTCDNGIIELGETCDPPGTGCSDDCLAEEGYVCPRPGACFPIPECGDGIVQVGEECDTGELASDGCEACGIAEGWYCYGLQLSLCERPVCGDGILSIGEECDDHNLEAEDGCGDACTVEVGWTCPEANEPCIPICGDGLLTGDEDCDDENRVNGDGCNAACYVEPGFVCSEPGEDCVPSECGNGDVEPGEGCDDGNSIAGDGCGPTCQNEPTVTVGPNPVVHVTCGDGMVTGNEECDDGNSESGDGCSGTEDDDLASHCQEEAGFECTEDVEYPAFVEFAVTLRDFKARSEPGGHPDFQRYPGNLCLDIPGPVCETSNSDACEAVPGDDCPAGTCGVLDEDGKPALHLTGANLTPAYITDQPTFALWYRNASDSPDVGAPNPDAIEGEGGVIEMCHVDDSLRLEQVGGTGSDVYQYSRIAEGIAGHFPLGDRCFGYVTEGYGEYDPNDSSTWRNYHFTTELRYFFQYQGGETLTFLGDDDVWVFINGRLAVDIGGLHSARWGRVVLGDDGDGAADDSDCSIHGLSSATTPGNCDLEGEELDELDDKRFGLVPGGVYEIVLFHAERFTDDSNFQLTLAGFLPPRSYCSPICGDGVVVGREVCDDGTYDADDEDHDGEGEYNSDTVYGACNTSCTMRTFCGDRVVQVGDEQCDNGRNLDLYSRDAVGECAPGCILPPRCGDGVVQASKEECDNGEYNTDDAYGLTECRRNCKFGGFCGDGDVNGDEACDRGEYNGQEYGPTSCGYDCKPGPYCGDHVRNGGEQCDGTDDCRVDCTLSPFCGDGVRSSGEDCDYGQFASDDYGGCTDDCKWAANCGDGNLDEPYEECDLGEEENVGGYDGCSATCMLGPHCGDGTLQKDEGEACDNGHNDDVYAYSSDSCGPGCTLPPHCGDGNVEPSFELCDEGEDNDDDAYNGCTTSCVWGPYCGDGEVAPEESCDEGPDNTFYSTDGAGCGPDCEPAPYCGDGVRNGREQCDEGSDDNTGEYGGCKEDCTRAPYCGDKIVQRSQGESCDDGPIGSLSCSPECKQRIVAY